MYSIDLQWKEVSLDLVSIEAWMKANAGEFYTGNSADSALHLWFSEEPSQEVKDAIAAYWDALDAESPEAVAYKPQAERLAEEAAALAAAKSSAHTKLAALGLTEEEISAIIG